MISNLIVEVEVLELGDNRAWLNIYNSNLELLARLVFKKSNAQNCSMCAVKDALEKINARSPRLPHSEHDICLLCCTRLTYMIPDLDTMGMTASECVHLFRGGVVKKKARRNENKKDTRREG